MSLHLSIEGSSDLSLVVHSEFFCMMHNDKKRVSIYKWSVHVNRSKRHTWFKWHLFYFVTISLNIYASKDHNVSIESFPDNVLDEDILGSLFHTAQVLKLWNPNKSINPTLKITK